MQCELCGEEHATSSCPNYPRTASIAKVREEVLDLMNEGDMEDMVLPDDLLQLFFVWINFGLEVFYDLGAESEMESWKKGGEESEDREEEAKTIVGEEMTSMLDAVYMLGFNHGKQIQKSPQQEIEEMFWDNL